MGRLTLCETHMKTYEKNKEQTPAQMRQKEPSQTIKTHYCDLYKIHMRHNHHKTCNVQY